MFCDFCRREVFRPCRDAKDMSYSSTEENDQDCRMALMDEAKRQWEARRAGAKEAAV